MGASGPEQLFPAGRSLPYRGTGRVFGPGTYVYRQFRGDNGATFPDFADLPPIWDTAAEYVAAFPNVLLGVHRDHAYSIVLVPVARDRTSEKANIYYATPETDAGMRAQNAALWEGVFKEDVFVVEGMQRGRAAPGFDGGRFSPAMDGPTHLFHDWVARQMMETDTPLAAE